MISKRLLSLVNYISFDDKVIDVGCDHALLDIYLIKNGFLNNVIVSDIHEEALKSGIENIKNEGLESVISARLGNGLEVLNTNDNVDTLLISGMGTNTILKILDNEYTKRLNKLIIQSNNDHYLLRKNICNMGFRISDESYVYDNNKYYVNIFFVRGSEEYSDIDLKYGPILKNNAKEYYKYQKNKLESIFANIPQDSKDRVEFDKKIKELDEFI